jgi:site-specific DNA-cytosine methylase
MTVRVLELYCGIGGCAAALGPAAEVVAAIDINRAALAVYRHNFPHPAVARTIDAIEASDLRRWATDLWWLSPPCQPFTRRGLRRDDADPRSASLLRLIELMDEVRPPCLALENVPGFAGSRTHARLRELLDRLGYQVRERLLCPTELEIPNRRRRFYLVAAREPLLDLPPPDCHHRPLAEVLDPHPAPELWPPAELVERYRHAIDLVEPDDPQATTSCFTAAYGRSPVRSGSYVATARGPRRFSPGEILRLLGFPAGFRLPTELSPASAWRLAGNSLSVDVVRWVLAQLPDLATTGQGQASPRCSPTRSRAVRNAD